MNKNRSYESDKLMGFGNSQKFLGEFQHHGILTNSLYCFGERYENLHVFNMWMDI